MGKGTILSGGNQGQYGIELVLDVSVVTEALVVLAVEIAELQNQVDAQQIVVDDLQTDIDTFPHDGDPDEFSALLIQIVEEQNNLTALRLSLTARQKRETYLVLNTPSNPQVTIWCSDYTQNLSASVGTIEIPGERTGGTVQIQPGYSGNAVYSASRDGQLHPSIAMTPSAVAYNWAMLSGWQKFKPTHRFGTITAIDHGLHTCDVDLDTAYSSVSGQLRFEVNSLDVNQSTTLESVSIDYMH